MTKTEFILKLRPAAQAIEESTGIRADFAIVQAAHESAWGNSELARIGNNIFGFTGESWATAGKPVVYRWTREFENGKWVQRQRPFRKYSSWEESVNDWARLLQTPHYTAAFSAAKAGNFAAFAAGLQAAGYATDPAYFTKLAGVAKTLNVG